MERMARIIESTALGGNEKPILFLRYNPGTAERIEGKWRPNFQDHTVDQVPNYVSKSDRESKLFQFLDSWEFPETDQRVYIKYLFYDETDGAPSVIKDPEYHPEMVQCVI
jgi:hypothetical protein